MSREYWVLLSFILHFSSCLSADRLLVAGDALDGIEPGMNLKVLPYLSSGYRQDRPTPFSGDNKNVSTGVDVRYGVTSNLTTVLTVNPDYA